MTQANLTVERTIDGIPLSPSVATVVDGFGDDTSIRAWDIVQKLLALHPGYGQRKGKELASDSGPPVGYFASASEWLRDVRLLVDAEHTRRLHGKLVILGLSRLDLSLAAYLDSHGMIEALKNHLREPVDSVFTGQPSPDVKCREAFLDLLWNWGKYHPSIGPAPRDRGFVGLVLGTENIDICHLQDLCLRQNYNTCLTASYRLRQGQGLSNLTSYFLKDLHTLVSETGEPRGRLVPHPGVAEWKDWLYAHASPLLQKVEKLYDSAEQLDWLVDFIDALAKDEVIRIGSRLVLFAELQGVPADATFADLGFTEEVLKILDKQPERFGIVLSGLPESIEIPSFGPHFRVLPNPTPEPSAPPVRGQAFANDRPVGPDRLNIETEVHALAETLALKEMKPPLVVGVLGGWGWGKSFVLHLLEERLRDIRCYDRTQPPDKEGDGKNELPYVGHPYVIRFDAWTYAKQGLWASLMQTILMGKNVSI